MRRRLLRTCRHRKPFAVGAIPVVVAAAGWLTNVLTAGWNWWLFAGLAMAVGLSSGLAIISEVSANAPNSGSGTFQQPTHQRPPVWLDVPPRSPNFTGRESLLARIDRQPENGEGITALVAHALYGLGGVGKTHLALEYAHRTSSSFDLVAWIPAEQHALLRSAYRRLAAAMEVPESGDLERTVELVRDGLRRGVPFKRWLVIFDNAESPASLRTYLPESIPPHSVGKVLVTTRDRTWSTIAETIEVEVLHRHESVALLRRRIPGVSDEEAVQLAKKLGDLPLALEQASAWIDASGTAVSEYLRLLATRIEDLLQINRAADYPRSVAAAWGVAVEQLSMTDAAAVYLLNLCAFLGPEPIARDLLTIDKNLNVPTAAREMLRDPVRLGQAFTQIGRFSLAKLNPIQGTIQLHRLVQTVLRARLTVEEQTMWRSAAHELIAECSAKAQDPDQSGSWPLFSMINPHVHPAGCLDSKLPPIRDVVIRQARYLYIRGDYKSCYRLAGEAWRRWQDQVGVDHEQTLRIALTVANAARALGDIVLSREVDKDTLDRARQTLGDLHPVTLSAASGYGADLRISGRYLEAYELGVVTLERCRIVFGPDDRNTAMAINNLATSLRLLADFSGALELYKMNRSLCQTIHDGPRGAAFVECMTAVDLYYNGRYTEAAEILRNAVPEIDIHFQIYHDTALFSLRYYAIVTSALGCTAEAMRLSQEALHRYRATKSERHPEVLTMMMTAATIARAKDPTGALKLSREALRLHHEVHGEDHPATIAALINAAIVERNSSLHEQAARYDDRAVKLARRFFGADHWATLCAQMGLATDYALAGDYGIAAGLSQDTHELSVTKRGVKHPYTMASAVNLILDLRSVGERDRSARHHQDLRAIIDGSRRENEPLLRALKKGQRIECPVELPEY